MILFFFNFFFFFQMRENYRRETGEKRVAEREIPQLNEQVKATKEDDGGS